ncbi:hypothetical protein, partial [Xanthomonas perforans]|uniref:hypothetical protein n=2 Tax=Xanthomonas perforans TaxID=442694 RepID=UPI001F31E781
MGALTWNPLLTDKPAFWHAGNAGLTQAPRPQPWLQLVARAFGYGQAPASGRRSRPTLLPLLQRLLLTQGRAKRV